MKKFNDGTVAFYAGKGKTVLIFGAVMVFIIVLVAAALGGAQEDGNIELTPLGGFFAVIGFMAWLFFAILYEPAPIITLNKRDIKISGHPIPFLWEDINYVMSQRLTTYRNSSRGRSGSTADIINLTNMTVQNSNYYTTLYLIIDVNKPDRYPAMDASLTMDIEKMMYPYRLNIEELNFEEFELLEAELAKYTSYCKGSKV